MSHISTGDGVSLGCSLSTKGKHHLVYEFDGGNKPNNFNLLNAIKHE